MNNQNKTTETEKQFLDFVNSICEKYRSFNELAKLSDVQKSYLIILWNKHIYGLKPAELNKLNNLTRHD